MEINLQKGKTWGYFFYSQRGGSGVSTLAWNLARQFATEYPQKVLFLELNLNRNSLFHEAYRQEPPVNILDHFISPAIPHFRELKFTDSFFERFGVKVLPFMSESKIIDYDQHIFDAFQIQDRYKMRTLLGVLAQKFEFIFFDSPPVFSFFLQDCLKFSDQFFYLTSPNKFETGVGGYATLRKTLLDNGFPDENIHWVANNCEVEDVDRAQGKFKTAPLFHLPKFSDFKVPLSEEKSPQFNGVFGELGKLLKSLPPFNREKDPLQLKEVGDKERQKLNSYKKDLQVRIVDLVDKRVALSDSELKRQVKSIADKLFEQFPPPGLHTGDVADLKKDIVNEITGLGPLEDLLEDPEIDEIMVNGADKIFVEREGKIVKSKKTFSSNEQVKAVIDRILMPIGRQINELTPYVDGRLLDGSRIHAIIPPLSLIGPMLTIRKFSKTPFTMTDMVQKFHSLSPGQSEFLKLCVNMKKNILVSGGAGSGKTSLLNVISDFIPDNERVLTIEDSAELRMNREHVGRLETRAVNVEGSRAKVTIRDLVINALRMRPDRIVVGECRGGEALDMLQAMNTGHQGSMTTIHANSPSDTISRLETMVFMAGVDLPIKAIRNQIVSAIDFVVQMSRFNDGSRKLQKISEVCGLEGDEVLIKDIFVFEQKWVDDNGRIYGDYVPTGHIPKFLSQITMKNFTFPLEIFEKEKKTVSTV